MSGKDIERGNYLRKLFEKQLDKSDPKGSHEERHKEAEKRMDAKLGAGWRDEVARSELEFVQVTPHTPLPPAAVTGFYTRVQQLGDDEGLGDKGSEAPEDGERKEEGCDKARTIKKIMELLKNL